MQIMSTVWLNNAFVSDSDATISLRDTGLLHAAGVFTTMKAVGGRVFRLEQHLARIRHSCGAMTIPLQYGDAVLTGVVSDVLAKNELTEARLRLTVTRGSAQPAGGMVPTVFVTASDFEPYPREFYERGMTVVLIDDQKLNPYDIQAGHKTLNYASRLAALRTANARKAGEALWFDVHNYLQSGSISNVFTVKDGTVLTPPTPVDMEDPALNAAMPYPRSCVLPGIMRQAVIDTATAAGIAVKRQALDIGALLSADELFLTNSIMEVMPVCRIEKQAVGDDRPGPVTKMLMESITEKVGE
jgi:branched-chain amino acid aminotransferase